MLSLLRKRLQAWKLDHRYPSVIKVCLPLVMSMAAVTVMEFTDRIFLSNYSLDAISAVTPSGIVVFVLLVFFSGITAYSSVFVAQYTGAGNHHQIGGVLWQGIYFALGSGVLLAGVSFFAEPIFRMGGHPPEIQLLEVVYFRIMCLGSILYILTSGLAAFYTGRGETRPVMLVNAAGMLFNIPLDYALINGIWIFPEMGIAGAAIATVSSWGLIVVLYACLIFTPANDRYYRVRKTTVFNKELSLRMLKFGIPGSLQFTLDIAGFVFFFFLVGRIGKAEMAASNIVSSINSLAFTFALGFSQGVSTLVGQALGRGEPLEAQRAVWSVVHFLLLYTALVALLYIVLPRWLISFFIPSGERAASFASVLDTSCTLLRIVSVYIIFDALYLVFVGALRGAGDTRFIMLSIGCLSVLVLILPVFIGIEIFHMGIFYAWACVALFIVSLFLVTGWRYRQGKWQAIRMVGHKSPTSSSTG